jgi:branched-chain amino acid transport system permease protein
MKFEEIKRSAAVSLWFMFLTFPILVIRVNTVQDVIEWRWKNMVMVGIGSFFLSFLWRFLIRRKERGSKNAGRDEAPGTSLIQRMTEDRRVLIPTMTAILLGIVFFPFIFSMYQTNIMINALMYVMLGLGLNIVVGLAGLLDLGYVAFYAVGAYSYALLNHHFGLGFWAALPIGAALGAIFGILLGFPVLRLRGDYLAIVTLGFGEIIRLILENWNDFSFGPSGISNISRPFFLGLDVLLKKILAGFGIEKTIVEINIICLYFLMILMTVMTIFVVNRLQNSRIGRAWIALREDEIACQAMGIDRTKTKLTAFALGATWAGMAGVVFAAKTTFINPASFTIWESIIILCVVVLGGMGSIVGVIFGSMVLILLPEYLRAFSEFRMLAFGIILVMMMVFRPGGIISSVRRTYQLSSDDRQ